MLYIITLVMCVGVHAQVNNTKSTTYYETYTGNFITSEKYQEYVTNKTAPFCTAEFVGVCDPNEGRRVDGTCNNLKYPTRGSSYTPTYRLLKAYYDGVPEFNPRKANDGGSLPLERPIRKALVQDGRVPDQKFTHLLTYALISFSNDVIDPFDILNYVILRSYCCTAKGATDNQCVQNVIPADDPVHQFSGIRCMNMTRPRSFQSVGCAASDTTPVRFLAATPSFDLSQVYGSTLANLNNKGRMFEGGCLKYETENGKLWPPSATTTSANLCILNEKPRETRCHDGPETSGNGILGNNLCLIWQWRYHNVIAKELSTINPCWNDEKIFQTAKDINIAYMMQIYYYEMFGSFMGTDNLVNDKVLSKKLGFRSLHNENVYPQISVEYPFALRWIHLLQETKVKMYDAEGYHLKDVKMVNLTLRTGYLVDNLEYITQGAFRQPCGKINDITLDPDLGDKTLGPHQKASDVTTNDLAKNRYFGFAPYIHYKKLCTGKDYKEFADLLDSMDPEYVEQLQEIYKQVEDIDLMAGMWGEKRTYGSVAPTFYCIITKQLLRNIISDRHWYESQNRPGAFTLKQLLEIRKATIARLLCDVGDSVTEIQPKAFLRPGARNKIRSCDLIPKMNFEVWKDTTCCK